MFSSRKINFSLIIIFAFNISNSGAFHELGNLVKTMNEFDKIILNPLSKICDRHVKIVDDSPTATNFDTPKFRLCQTVVSMGKYITKANFKYKMQNWSPIGIGRRITGETVKDEGDLEEIFIDIRYRVVNDLDHLRVRFWSLVNNEEIMNKLWKSAQEATDINEHFKRKVAELMAMKENGETTLQEKIEVANEMLYSGYLLMKELGYTFRVQMKWALQQFAANLIAYDILDGNLVKDKGVLGIWPIGNENE